MVKKVLLIVFGVVGALVGAAMVVGGTVLFAITSGDGWINSDTRSVTTGTFGFLSEPQAISHGTFTTSKSTEVHLRVQAQPTAGKEIFIGVGPTVDVDGYLDGVPIDLVTDIGFSPFRLSTQPRDGTSSPEPPTDQDFWSAEASGSGQQTLDWVLPSGTGDYRVVLMNADGSRGVTADASVGVRVPFLRSLGLGLLIAGGILALVGLLLFIWGLMTKVPPRAAPAGPYPYPGAGWPPPGSAAYPASGYGPYPPPPGTPPPLGTPPPPGWPPPPPYGQPPAPPPGAGYPRQPEAPSEPPPRTAEPEPPGSRTDTTPPPDAGNRRDT